MHWFRVRERIAFKTVVLVYRVLNGTAPSYMAYLHRASSVQPSRSGMRSSGVAAVAAAVHKLVIPSPRCVTIGPRAFPVAGLTV